MEYYQTHSESFPAWLPLIKEGCLQILFLYFLSTKVRIVFPILNSYTFYILQHEERVTRDVMDVFFR